MNDSVVGMILVIVIATVFFRGDPDLTHALVNYFMQEACQ